MDYEKEIEKKNEEILEMKKELEKLKKYDVYKKSADDLAVILQSFIDAGFTREEAFQIILAGMQSGAKR